MKILLTCENYFPHVGGAEVCVHNLRKILTARGHVVTLFTNTTERTEDEAGVVRMRWSFSPVQLFRHIRTLRRLIGQADIVHCQYSFRLAAIAGPLCVLRGKPMILTQQGKGIVPEADIRWRHKLPFWICQHLSMHSASHITTTSDEITELTAAFVPRSKITLISNGYDDTRFRPDPSLPLPVEYAEKGNAPRILTVRRLVPKNGIHILIQALALVRDAGMDFTYFAIGTGRVEPFIRSLIKEYNLEDRCVLLGAKPNEEIVHYYQHADLVIIPSSAEARSLACVEAMGMQKPIIASRVGGLIDLLGTESTYGELVRIYDTEACNYGPPDRLSAAELQPLVDAIVAFLKNPEPLREKAKQARALVEKEYAWSTILDQYIALYTKFLPKTEHDAR